MVTSGGHRTRNLELSKTTPYELSFLTSDDFYLKECSVRWQFNFVADPTPVLSYQISYSLQFYIWGSAIFISIDYILDIFLPVVIFMF